MGLDNDNSIKFRNDLFLFLVVLGGTTKSSHIELHDVRWVIGKRIEETFNQLSLEWFGETKGLHIDSYMKVEYIDGYKINIRRISNRQIKSVESLNKIKNQIKYLWFVNIGAYSSKNLSELHQFGLIVAKSSKEAIYKAKERWLNHAEKQHRDDIYSLEGINRVDDCHAISSLGRWEILLTTDEKKRSQLLIPDWYGFMRIDKR